MPHYAKNRRGYLEVSRVLISILLFNYKIGNFIYSFQIMNLRFLLSVFVIISFLSLKAQDLPMYTIDLDNEMHYKVNATNWQERGIKEFKEDMCVLFKKNDFISNKSRINVFFEIEFNEFGNPKLSLLSMSDTYEEDILERQIKKKISKLVNDFKPARYEGKIIAHKYLVHFNVSLKNDLLSISNVGFEPTLSFDNLKTGSGCFTIYSKTKGNTIPEAIFIASEIEPEYKGDTNFLCFNLNRRLDTKYDVKISRKAINRDSIDIPLIINKVGKLGILEVSQPSTALEIEILNLIKTTSCDWRPAISSGRPLHFALRLRFVYEYIVEKENQTKKLVHIPKIIRLKALKNDLND
jgi:hypothetical protein